MGNIPSTQTGMTFNQGDARYPLLIDVSTSAGASKIPRAGVDGRIAIGFLPDLSGTYQPLDSDLTAIAALSPSNGTFIRRTGGAWVAAALVSGDIPDLSSIYQPLDSDLTAIAALSPTNGDFIRRTGGVWVNTPLASGDIPDLSATYLVDADIGVTVQAFDADLAALAAISPTNGQFLVGRSGAWAKDVILSADLTTPLTTPPAIGGTTPAAGSFTTLSSNSPTASAISVSASATNPIGVLVTNANAQGTSIYKAVNDTGKTVSMAVYGSTFALTDFRNQGAFGADNSIIILSDGGIASGGTNSIQFRTGGYNPTNERGRISSVGLWTMAATDAATVTVTNVLTLSHNSTGTPAASFGTGLLFTGESDTTVDTSMARVRSIWTTPTHASRVSNLILSVFNIASETDVVTLKPTVMQLLSTLKITPSADAVNALAIAANAGSIIQNFDTTNSRISFFHDNPRAPYDLIAPTADSTVGLYYRQTSAELITVTADRDMSGANNWTGTNWAVSGGVFLHTAGSTADAVLANANLTASSILTGAQDLYEITVTVAMSAGTLIPKIGAQAASTISAAGTYKFWIQAGTTNGNLIFTPSSDFAGSIDNVSLIRHRTVLHIDNTGLLQSLGGLHTAAGSDTVPASARSSFGTDSSNNTIIRSTSAGIQLIPVAGGAITINTTGNIAVNPAASFTSTSAAATSVTFSNPSAGSSRFTLNVKGATGQVAGGEAIFRVLDVNAVVLASVSAIGAGLLRPLDAVTATITDALILGHATSGTPAASYGAAINLQLSSDTTADIAAGRIRWLWTTATHASRVSNLILSVYNISTETDVLTLIPTGITSLSDTDSTNVFGRTRLNSRLSDFAIFSHFDASSNTQYALAQGASGNTFLNSASGQLLAFQIAGSTVSVFGAAGLKIGGATNPSTRLHVIETDAATNTVTNVVTVAHNTSGTPAASYGTGLIFTGQSDTTADQTMGRVRTLWTTATHASRVSNLILSAYNISTEVDVVTIAPTNFFINIPYTNPATSTNIGVSFRATGKETVASSSKVVYGFQNDIWIDATNTQDWTNSYPFIATRSRVESRTGSLGTFTAGIGFWTELQSGGGTFTNWYGYYGKGASLTGGALTNMYGIYLENQNQAATLNFAIVTNAGKIVFNEGGDSASDVRMEGDTDANLFFLQTSTDFIGIGVAAPGAKLHIVPHATDKIGLIVKAFSSGTTAALVDYQNSSGTTFGGVASSGQGTHIRRDSGTSTVANVLTVGHDSSGTPAANFGGALQFQLGSSTTPDQEAGRIKALWTTATHASRVSNLVFSTYNISTEVDVMTLKPQQVAFNPASFDPASATNTFVVLNMAFASSGGVSTNNNSGFSAVLDVTVASDPGARTIKAFDALMRLTVGGGANYGGTLIGFHGEVYNDTANRTLTNAVGVDGLITVGRSGSTITTGIAVRAQVDAGTGTTLTTGYGFYYKSKAGAGTYTNLYGLYLEDVSGAATLNFALVTNAGLVVFNEGGADADLRMEGDTLANLFFLDASADKIGLNTNAPTAVLDINSDILRLRTAKTPASAGAAGNQGDIAWDSGFIYVCIAASTWVRAALSSW